MNKVMKKIKLFVETGFNGCTHEKIIYRKKVNPDELNELARQFADDEIEYGFEVIDGRESESTNE